MRPSEGLWRPTMHSKSKARKPSFAFARLPIGKSTLPLSRPKCSGAGCFSRSSIGRKIRLHEALRAHRQTSSSHRRPYSSRLDRAAAVVGLAQSRREMSAKTPENVIIRAIHEAFIRYPEGDGSPTLDYQWVQPEQSSHVAKAIILELAANGFEIVRKGA